MAKTAKLHVAVAVAEHEDFVIHCYFKPLSGQNGRQRVPFLPLFFISRAYLGDVQRRVGAALWEWMGRASFESSPEVSESQSGEKLGLTFSKPGDEEKGTPCKTGLSPGSRDIAVNILHLHVVAGSLIRSDLSCPISVFFSVGRSEQDCFR